MIKKPERYTKLLSPTPCTEKMKEEITELAKRNGISVAELTRQALSIFLQENYTSRISQDTIGIQKGDNQ